MTNLPITANTTQTAAASRQTVNAAETGDTQNSQPFGEVLARQISDPAATDVKVTDKLAVDMLAQTVTDTSDGETQAAESRKTSITAPDSTTEPPTDMLAALIPQGMNATSATAIDTKEAEKSDSAPGNANAARVRHGTVPPKNDLAAALQNDATEKSTKGTNTVDPGREQPFAATLTESANRNAPAVELKSVLREAVMQIAPRSAAVPQADATGIASLQNTSVSSAAPAVQSVQMTINTPVNQNRWGDEFSQKITWLASSNQDQTAELHLNPPKLGPLDVVIKVSGDQATAQFTSQHAAVREAIELAMPRLREMLADNGITLGNTTVSDQAPRDQSQSGTLSASDANNNIQDTSTESKGTARVSPISRHDGIVDTFA